MKNSFRKVIKRKCFKYWIYWDWWYIKFSKYQPGRL